MPLHILHHDSDSAPGIYRFEVRGRLTSARDNFLQFDGSMFVRKTANTEFHMKYTDSIELTFVYRSLRSSICQSWAKRLDNPSMSNIVQ